MTVITIIGLGEAGSLYAKGLRAAGATVRGFDPFVHRDVPHNSVELTDALADADLVMSLVGATASEQVAEHAMPLAPASAVYADCNTASPERKLRVAAIGERHGIPVADVAILAPVPRAAERTPLIVSGTAASSVAALLAPFGVPVERIDGGPGAAARLKLLRSVFMKGLATLVIEGLDAAEAVGADAWLRGQIADELGGDERVEHLIAGTYQHAVRREHEVRDALAALDAGEQHADMTRATLAWFERIVAERA